MSNIDGTNDDDSSNDNHNDYDKSMIILWRE